MSRVNLHDLLKKNAFDHAVICTFTFDPPFFEGYCLDRFAALTRNNNVSVIVDRRIYDAMTDASPADWPRLANTRYLVHPIAVAGVFHSKLFLFASKNKGLLVIGSANFTRSGLTTNGELVGVYRFERGSREEHLALFHDAFGYLTQLAARWPSAGLDSNLSELSRDAHWLTEVVESQGGAPRLLHNLEAPIWEQLVTRFAGPVDELHVLSRFFDGQPSILNSVYQTCNPKRVRLWTQNGITTMSSAWFRHPSVKAKRTEIYHCLVGETNKEQPLHAKAIAMVRGKEVQLAFGSANFSTPGILAPCGTGNVEVMVVIPKLLLRDCNPTTLFDPCGNAEQIKTVDALFRGAPEDIPERIPASGLELIEARLDDALLTCRCDVAPEIKGVAITATLAGSDGGEARVPLRSTGHVYTAVIDNFTKRLCDEGTTVVRLETSSSKGSMVVSNRMLLQNLKDIESGGSQRRERSVREAQESAGQFFAVLGEILATGQLDELRTFLTYCDIPMINAARPFGGRATQVNWDTAHELRALGARNLREYQTLHEAAIGFCDRHLRRLERHCEKPSLPGLPNFMHITLAIGDVAWAQLGRLLVGLETVETPLRVDDWSSYRRDIDQYLMVFEKVVDILSGRYLPAIERRFKATAIREALVPDLDALLSLQASFLAVRDRVEQARRKGLRVQTPLGDVLEAAFFSNDLLNPPSWDRWSSHVRRSVERVASGRAVA